MTEKEQWSAWHEQLIAIINDINTPHTLGGITNDANRAHDSRLARRALDNLIVLSEEINAMRQQPDEN
ncbi:MULTISPECIES: hypothetical protein [Leuconostoc]|uniref:Uncharacterized protein n=2 Tax=Leuconostoc kimchii TaxID=136609 RepID=D5T5A6_LEUKI|nr:MULTISPECIES: hypothetical protein [Leuconostoc]ADG41236.1 hypothetical protein LKI_08485 [Leuconostoc kimchii IMSNU 11154]AEJ30789.1 hypothetical protein LGMK_03655 [Leuconostoc sp. C2]QBR47895.1 hypothetical protein EW139_07070 [Leuconostoc kimchii]